MIEIKHLPLCQKTSFDRSDVQTFSRNKAALSLWGLNEIFGGLTLWKPSQHRDNSMLKLTLHHKKPNQKQLDLTDNSWLTPSLQMTALTQHDIKCVFQETCRPLNYTADFNLTIWKWSEMKCSCVTLSQINFPQDHTFFSSGWIFSLLTSVCRR